jgi:hypothetical protein
MQIVGLDMDLGLIMAIVWIAWIEHAWKIGIYLGEKLGFRRNCKAWNCVKVVLPLSV